jgi:hypothetical protein
VDREALARAARRRQALEALEFERARADALHEQLERIAAELDGESVDERAFAALPLDDVAAVRAVLHGVEPEWFDDEPADEAEPEPGGDGATTARTEHEAELTRLEEELAASSRVQRALERYLAALGD